MKTLFFLLLALPAMAANHVFFWSPNPTNELVGGYNLYSQIGTQWVRIASVAAVTTMTVSNVTPGWKTYSLTATNAIGESAMSQPVQAFVPIIPSPPTNILIQLQARVTGASGNQVASFFIPQCATERQSFFTGEMVATNLTIASRFELTGRGTPVAILPVPSTATRSKLFANR